MEVGFERGVSTASQQGQQRRQELPEKYKREVDWFALCDVPENVLNTALLPSAEKSFKELIWDTPQNTVIPEFGMTVDEMASLCGSGEDGWLLTSHIVHVLQKITKTHDETLCFCLNSATAACHMKQIKQQRLGKVKRIVLVMNVGKLGGEKVFIGSDQRSGSHWTLAVINVATSLPTAKVIYCDSMAWNCPEGLATRLNDYTEFFNMSVSSKDIELCHFPTPAGNSHSCDRRCLNYPLQTCANVCGVVCIVMSAVASLDQRLFSFLCGPQKNRQCYLNSPTKYEKYLRKVLINWFMTGNISIRNISLKVYQSNQAVTNRRVRLRPRKNVHMRNEFQLPQPFQHVKDVQKQETSTVLASKPLEKDTQKQRLSPASTSYPLKSGTQKQQPSSTPVSKPLERGTQKQQPSSTSVSKPLETGAQKQQPSSTPVSKPLEMGTQKQQPSSTPVSKPLETGTQKQQPSSTPVSKPLEMGAQKLQPSSTPVSKPLERGTQKQQPSSTPVSKPLETGAQKQQPFSTPVSKPLETGAQKQQPSSTPVSKPLEMGAQKLQPSSTPVSKPLEMGAQKLQPSSTPVSKPLEMGTQKQQPSSTPVSKPLETGTQKQQPFVMKSLIFLPVPKVNAGAQSSIAPQLQNGPWKNIEIQQSLAQAMTYGGRLALPKLPLAKLPLPKLPVPNNSTSDVPKSGSIPSAEKTPKAPPQIGKSAPAKGCSTPNKKVSTSPQVKPSKFSCPLCQKGMSNRANLSRHKMMQHPEAVKTPAGKLICSQCRSFRCRFFKELVQHQNDAHGQNFCVQQKELASEEDFEKWKTDIETEKNFLYVKDKGDYKSKTHRTAYYSCFRSGSYTPKGKGKRSIKSQGSSKLQGHCCAFIKEKIEKSSGKVSIEYCDNHTHGNDVSHLKLSEKTRSFIAEKLASGVNTKKLLCEIQDMNTLNDRDRLLRHRDILNIQNQFNIHEAVKDKDDLVSTAIWVEELRAQEYDPVLVFKPRDCEEYGLGKDEVLLGVQTEFQKDMMRLYGADFLCADSTLKSTQYDYHLTTLSVVDHTGEACPVAFLISSKVDQASLELFMLALRERAGQLQVEVFMSDLGNCFYDAWCQVFPKPNKRFYCSWQVEKDWKANVNIKETSPEKQSDIYAFLKMLQRETVQKKFRKMLKEFLAYLEDKCLAFLDYFNKSYIANDKIQLWAGCFRKGDIVNISESAEDLHKVLRNVYFKRKQNLRVDVLLKLLLEVACDKAQKQLTEHDKRKGSNKVQETVQRHPKNDDHPNIVTNVEERKWKVTSTDGKETYMVERLMDDCSCKLKCSLCSVCLHMFSCTCVDYLVQLVACRHTHVVRMMLNDKGADSSSEDENHDDNDLSEDDITVDYVNNHSKSEEAFQKLKQKSSKTLNKLTDILKSTSNIDIVRNVTHHLEAALKAAEVESVEVTNQTDQSSSTNEVCNAEVRGDSVNKRRRKNQDQVFKVPAKKAKKDLSARLDAILTNFCGICFKEHNLRQGAVQGWRQCSACRIWVHIGCDDFPENREYMCLVCRTP